MVKPISKGRRKIVMKKIKDRTSLCVTFTKRRNGLFKKASELVALCGVEVAILIFSPGNKAYSFGHPDVQSVIGRFLGHVNLPENMFIQEYMENIHRAKSTELNVTLKNLQNEIEALKKFGKELRIAYAEGYSVAMMPREQLNYQQMIQLRLMMHHLRSRMVDEVNYRPIDNATNYVQYPFDMGNSGLVYNNFGGNA